MYRDKVILQKKKDIQSTNVVSLAQAIANTRRRSGSVALVVKHLSSMLTALHSIPRTETTNKQSEQKVRRGNNSEDFVSRTISGKRDV
jgi:hypothetical protein